MEVKEERKKLGHFPTPLVMMLSIKDINVPVIGNSFLFLEGKKELRLGERMKTE